MSDNQAQREQWNDEGQVRNWPKRERITMEITPLLLAKLAPQSGERVLDIGCGGGLAAIAAARAVGPSGAVTGFDISAGLVAMASGRASEASLLHVRFVEGDAQVDAMPGAPFDAAMSQFGVMFFADPVAAFANIRKHLRLGGRLAFAAWQGPAKNAWFPIPVMAKYAQRPQAPAGSSPPAASAPSAPPPGPFAFADHEYVRGILTSAGFNDVQHEEIEHEVLLPEDSLFEREILDSLRLDPARAEEAWKDLQAFVDPLRTDDGHVRIRLAPVLVMASNRG